MEAAKDNSELEQAHFAQPLRVTTFGISEKAVKAMEVAFKNYGNNCAVIVNEQQAEVGIFDFDDIESRRKWIKFKAGNRDATFIILSSKELDIPGAFIVTKPMRVGKFIAIFQEIRGKKPPESGSSPAAEAIINVHKSGIETSPAAAVVEEKSPALITAQNHSNDSEGVNSSGMVLYSPEKYLQSVISEVSQEAIEKDIVIDLAINVHDEWETISFFPRLKRVSLEMNEQQLKYVCCTKSFCLESKIVRHSAKDSRKLEDDLASDLSMLSYEAFLWKVALWTGGGRLSRSFDQNAYYQLRRWPNLSRLEPISGSMSMSALLTDKPIRLALFLKLTGMDPRNVAAFLNSAYAAGLLKIVSPDTKIQTLDQVPQQSHPARGIFQKILDTLKGK